MNRNLLVAAFFISVFAVGKYAAGAENLIFVTWDGFRWQEVFSGAEERLISKESGGVPNVAETRNRFWRDTPEARRETLLPFVWGTIAKKGQLFGDPKRSAVARVTNGKKFSYPGYNEMFVGFADDRVRSNDKIPNPNINVLEYLHRLPAFSGRVACFATWDVFPFILNRERSGMLVHTGWTLLEGESLTNVEQQANQMVRELPQLWPNNVYDIVTILSAKEYLKKRHPRVLFVGLGETDEWAHARRYDLYLEAAQRSDRYLREFWEMLQSMPEYRGQTALVLTTDHGRGITPADWTNHSADTPEAEYIWIAAMGDGIPPLGVRENVQTTQSQIAATLAELVGEDFSRVSAQVAASLPLRSTSGSDR